MTKFVDGLRALWTAWIDADLHKTQSPIAPERIWLTSAPDTSGDVFASSVEDSVWSSQRTNADDVEYVRLDVALRMQAEALSVVHNQTPSKLAA